MDMDGALTSTPGDPIETYISVLNALENLHRAPVLGEVLNGMGDDEDEEEILSEILSDGKPGSRMTLWARRLGAQLAFVSHYTAFAHGGVADATVSTQQRRDRGGVAQVTNVTILHYLRVLRGGEIVASWPLNAPVPADELLAFCSPAPFGDLHTQTTVHEPTVRTAMELPAEASSPGGYSFEIAALGSGENHLTLPLQGPLPRTVQREFGRYGLGYANVTDSFHDVEMAPLLAASLASEIKTSLMRDAAVLVPYKLNVYGPGGFFKPHVDTPTISAAHMLGTAVLALPGSFTGGALRVCATAGHLPVHTPGKPPKYEVEFDWSSAVAETEGRASTQAGKLPWAAFFGDCVHEVLSVTSGHRITITFGIVAGAGPGPTYWDSDAASSDEEEPARGGAGALAVPAAAAAPPLVGSASFLARALATVAARPDGASSFGILLSHKYTLGAAAVGQLKGADAALYAALEAAGLYSLTLQPVAYHYYRCEGCPDSGEGAMSSHTVHAFGAPELDALRNSEHRASDGGAAVPRPGIPFVRFASPDSYIDAGATPGALLKHESIESAEHTGNEARAGSDDYIYFSVALLVVPQAAAAAPGPSVVVKAAV